MREFLKGLELEEDLIDTVMAEYGKNMTKNVEKIEQYKNNYTKLQTEYEELVKNNNSETLKTELEEYKNKYSSLENNFNELNGLYKVQENGIDKKFAKFVTKEVQTLVDDKTDFDTALNNYIKKNPQYKNVGAVKINTSVDLSGDGTKETNVNKFMNDMILKATGRK